MAPRMLAATGASRVGTRDRRSTIDLAKVRSSRSSRLAAASGRSSLTMTAAVCGCSAWMKLASAATGVSFSRSQTGRTALRRRPSTSLSTSSSSSNTAESNLRAALAPPATSGPVVSSSRNSTITASRMSWLILPMPAMALAKRSMSASPRSRRKAAPSSGPMAVRIIAAFSIGRGIRSGRMAGRGACGRPAAGMRAVSVMGRSSGPWRRRAGSSRRR